MTSELPDSTARPSLCAAPGSGFWLSGWQRRWIRCRRKMDDAPRVWKRLLTAESRYQLENGFGIYGMTPNSMFGTRSLG
jgi:hypothetical protein